MSGTHLLLSQAKMASVLVGVDMARAPGAVVVCK